MKIERVEVSNIRFCENIKDERVENGVLYFCPQRIESILCKDQRIRSIKIDIAKPGTSVRILPVKDVISPRAKKDGSIFPGFVDPIAPSGIGTTLILDNCAVVTTGPIVGFQEGIIDMSGPLTQYSLFGNLNLITLSIIPKEGLSPHEHEETVRIAGIQAACEIGKIGWTAENRIRSDLSLQEANGLPRIAYVDLCMAQGLLHDTYFYGGNLQYMTPMPVDPFCFIDGAVVSGNCVSPGSKTTTYHHQNNAVLKEIFRTHGRRFDFRGMVLSPLKTRLKDKERNSVLTTQMIKSLDVEGVVISQEGFGNPTTDLMMICERLEKSGIKTVLISNEDAGTDGYSESLPDSTPFANAVISTGNSNAELIIPPMEKTIGNLDAIEKITGGFHDSILPDGSLRIEVHGIMGSHNLQGTTYLSARSI